jgi:hypothetical protein
MSEEEIGTTEETTSEETIVEPAPQEEETRVAETTTEEEAEAEQLLAGKFKSQEELEKGYLNLESMATKQAQETARIRKQVEQVLPYMSGKPQTQPFPEPADEQEAAKLLVKDMMREVIQEQFGPLQAQSQVQSFAERHPDLEEYLPDIVSKLEAMTDQQRSALMNANPNLLEDEYYRVKGLRTDQVAQEAKKQGKEEVYKSATKKREAQVETASTTHKTKGSVYTLEELNALPIEEYAKVPKSVKDEAMREAMSR